MTEATVYNTEQHGFDRMLSFSYTFTVGGRPYGYFNMNKCRDFDVWYGKQFGPVPQEGLAPLLFAISVTATAIY